MTWARQVQHVLRKDLQESWKWAVPLVIGVVLGVARALGHIPAQSGADYVINILTTVSIASAATILIRSDPPAAITAFWSTLPLSPSAVATAKIAALACVMAVIFSGALVVMSAWHLNAGQVVTTLATLGSAVVAITAIGVFSTLLTADPTRKLTPYHAVWFAMVMTPALLIGFEAPRRVAQQLIHRLPEATWIPILAGCAIALVRLYQSREPSPQLRLAVTLAAVAPAIMFFRPRGPWPGTPEVRTDPAYISARAIWSTREDPRLSLEFSVRDDNGGEGMRFITDGTVTAYLTDGSQVKLPLTEARLLRADGALPAVRVVGPPLRELTAAPALRERTVYSPVWINLRDHAARMADGVTRFEVEGTLVDYAIHEVDRMPMRSGTTSTKDGRQVSMRTAPADSAGPTIRFRTRWLASRDRQAPWSVPEELFRTALTFSAIDTASRTLLKLRWTDSDFGTIPLTLPGFAVGEISFVLKPAVWSIARPIVGRDWFASAQIVVGTPVRTSARRLKLEAVMVTQD